ncbi:hypothetical protein EHQ83_16100 [Leptospira yasudae]|uniref:Uncharacterized protein n=1 Tax=Leptospira yasudae TaxID=2202201 RepID=A0A6N4QVM5_9LEPT|nr:hypothetical protein EHQ77_14010 [Leptospira yasudae]TGL79917.1 hypothetical protein EHQ72_07740 [Leptospira yasudae]TGL80738.1 hypothetical protein EHQ83_16100 [Leptospira yasudae]
MPIAWISNLASWDDLEWNQGSKRNPFVIIFLGKESMLLNLGKNFPKFIWLDRNENGYNLRLNLRRIANRSFTLSNEFPKMIRCDQKNKKKSFI